MPLDQDQFALLKDVAGDASRSPHSMPGWYYADPNLFELEKTKVFAEGWVCAGHASEITNTGQYMTVTIGNENVVVLRDREKNIRAYSNVCRHRGMALVEGKGKASVLTCPYHAWSYHLDGQLNKAPYMEDVAGFDPEACSLPEFKVEEWLGFVFVNTSGTAAPLAPQLEGMLPYLKNYHPEERHSTETWFEEWSTNWKCLIENFMEGYHLSITHAKTLDHVTPTRLCEKLASGPGLPLTGQIMTRLSRNVSRSRRLNRTRTRSSVLFNVYPNFVITVGPNCAVFLILLPKPLKPSISRWGFWSKKGRMTCQRQQNISLLPMNLTLKIKSR